MGAATAGLPMLTLSYLIAAAGLIALHEYAIARARRQGRAGGAAVRRILLGVALLCAMVFGARSDVPLLRGTAALQESGSPPFEGAGDLFLRQTLEAQRPDRPFPEHGTVLDVQSWQEHVRAVLRTRSQLPSVPAQWSPPRKLQSEDLGDVRRILLEFTSWDGTRVPAYLHQPKDAADSPAVLVIPGHGRGIRATAGVGPPDYQHGVALELARSGYVTLTPELRGFGWLGSQGPRDHVFVALAALEAGSFYKAVVARDLERALSILQDWPGVDRARLGAVGTSLGGELAVFLGALDSRIKVTVSHSYGGRVGPVSIADPEGQPPHGCHAIPGVNRILYQEDWFRLLAPRPVQVIRGSRNSPPPPAPERFNAAVAAAFDRFGARERFDFSIQPGEHEAFIEAAVRFLRTWL